MITDDIRYDAYILCSGSDENEIRQELKMTQQGIPRIPREGFCEHDILIRASKETLEYALKYYDKIRSYVMPHADAWQNLFGFLQGLDGDSP